MYEMIFYLFYFLLLIHAKDKFTTLTSHSHPDFTKTIEDVILKNKYEYFSLLLWYFCILILGIKMF